jgi:hypothetical protein
MPCFLSGCIHRGQLKSEGLPQIAALAGWARAPYLMGFHQPGSWARHLQASTCTPLDETSSRGRASSQAQWPLLCSERCVDRSTDGIWHHKLGSIAIHRGSVAPTRRVTAQFDASDGASL